MNYSERVNDISKKHVQRPCSQQGEEAEEEDEEEEDEKEGGGESAALFNRAGKLKPLPVRVYHYHTQYLLLLI